MLYSGTHVAPLGVKGLILLGDIADKLIAIDVTVL